MARWAELRQGYAENNPVFHHPLLREIAELHNRTVAQVQSRRPNIRAWRQNWALATLWLFALDFNFFGKQWIFHRSHNMLVFVQRGQQQPRQNGPFQKMKAAEPRTQEGVASAFLLPWATGSSRKCFARPSSQVVAALPGSCAFAS